LRDRSRLKRALEVSRLDFRPAPRQPSLGALASATVVSLAGSLAANAALVAIGTTLFPSTKGFVHFRFGDYATLTVVGTFVACAAWPVTTRITSSPRWLFLRLAFLVTPVLWAPDIYILLKGEPVKAVGVLMLMHLVVALVTYNALVRIASVESRSASRVEVARQRWSAAGRGPARVSGRAALAERRSVWITMIVLISIEFLLGIVALIAVPTGRTSGWVPAEGRVVYFAHTGVGLALALGAALVVLSAAHSGRLVRISGTIGAVGVALGEAGGLLTVDHGLRLLGLALMLVGGLVATMGYVMLAVEAPSERPLPDGRTAASKS